MKKIPMIIIMLSCIAVSITSVVLSHSNDKKVIPKVKIAEAPTKNIPHTSTEYTAQNATAFSDKTDNTETSSSISATSVADNGELYININTADLETLCKLDGIGEAIADEIIRYREENGGFRSIEEIMNVHRIGEKIFNKIRNNIYVDVPNYPNEENKNSDAPYEEIPSEASSDDSKNETTLTLDDVAPIELNSADKELLMYLPYVDENIADLIIELREKLHGFSYEYELLYIEELSEEQIAEIVRYVYIAEE